MSKLYKSYVNLKEKNSEKLYLFKSGMFYIFLQEDAQKISEIFGFKITKLNQDVIKCGFPSSRLEYYIDMMTKRNIPFEIIDNDYSKIENYQDYINNDKIKKIVTYIRDVDLDNITFREAYEILKEMKVKIGKIYEQRK